MGKLNDAVAMAEVAAKIARQAESEVSFAVALLEHLLETLKEQGVLNAPALEAMLNRIASDVDGISAGNEIHAEHKKKLRRMTEHLGRNLGISVAPPRQGIRRRSTDPPFSPSMCNLYSITSAREAIRALFRVSQDHTANQSPLPVVFPDQLAPVIRQDRDGARVMLAMRWGFPPPPGNHAAAVPRR